MGEPLDTLGLYYDERSYVEPGMVQGGVPSGGPPGVTGRQVACKGFLDAYLDAGEAGRLVAILARPSGREPLREALEAHPSPRGRQRRIEVVPESNFHATFFPDPPATVVHFPAAGDARYAWARQAGGPDTFAISGVAPAQASLRGVEALRDLVTAPFEPYDRVICPSRAAMATIRAVTDAYAGHLRERFGGRPGLRVPLEHIPHGVDTDRFRPATGEERRASRHRLGVDDDEICVLSVGRLSLHAKANPFPLFDGAARAARASGRKVHLVLAGWAATEGIHRAFQEGARVFAAGVRTTLVNGTDPEHRRSAWHAADAFALLADSLQETAGLAIAEAMASGLPVVASDWDGGREHVAHGETGFLVPTALVRGAGAGATSRLLLGEIGYDAFLGECSQAAAVDPFAAAAAFAALFEDDGLRRRMGEAGRRRALEHLTWGAAVRAYDRVWRDQEAERAERRAHRDREGEGAGGGRAPRTGPACYPGPDEAFAAFPTALLGEDARAVADPDARERLDWLLRMTMSSHSPARRSSDPAALTAALAAARDPATLADLAGALAGAGVPADATRPTLAWMLKYGLIRAEGSPPEGAAAPPGPGPDPTRPSPRDLAP